MRAPPRNAAGFRISRTAQEGIRKMARMPKTWKGTMWRAAAAAVSAALAWSAFSERGESLNICFALAPMLLVSRLSPRRVSARWWFVSSLAFWIATLSWMPAIIKNNGPWPLVVLGWGALSAYCAAFSWLFGWLVAWARDVLGEGRCGRFVSLFVAEPVLWAFAEWLRGNLFGGFAWNFLGVAAAETPFFASPASLGGVYLVSALVVLANGVIATFVERSIGPMLGRPREERTLKARLLRAVETGVPLAAVLLVLAVSRIPLSLSKLRLPVRVALVQRNFPCVFSGGARENPFDVYERLLSTASLARPDLTVFSESAMCEFGGARTEHAAAAVAKLRKDSGLSGAVLAGADDRETVEGARRAYNAAALYGADGPVQVYRKQHLVPFGEFIPLDKTFPVLQKLAPIGSLHPGGPKLLDVEIGGGGQSAAWTLKLAPLICFEDTDPSLARRAARDGAHLLAFITNDSWFSNSAEAVQHFRQSVLRCVETGLYAVRTGNSGVTGVIYPSGRFQTLNDSGGKFLVDAAGSMTHTINLPACNPVRPNGSSTVYTALGDVPLLSVSSVFILSIFALALRRRI